MKSIKIFSSFAFPLILFFLLFVTACSDKEEMETEEPGNSIVDIAASNSDFSTLVTALTRTNLVSALEGEGPFTVFAPTNAAFTNLLNAIGASGLDDIDNNTLSSILLYHVVPDMALSTSLSTGYINTLSTASPGGNNLSLYISTMGGVRINGNVNVVTADIQADNGIIHVVDNVITIPNLVDAALANNNFSNLVAAVVEAGLVDALNGDGPFTVFAPTNQAFEALLMNLGVSNVSEIPIETLTSVLLYHVVQGNVRASDLSNGDVPTLNGSTININLSGGVNINGNTQVIQANVQTSNGVIHAINNVLLPQ
mgnify:CR=1 FL=1